MEIHAPIGVFDSGVGGLTVAREIMRQIPEERLVYFGDTARLPYGSKSQKTILHFVRQINSLSGDEKSKSHCGGLQYSQRLRAGNH